MQKRSILVILMPIILLGVISCKPSSKISDKQVVKESVITRYFNENGLRFDLKLETGPEHNHPSFAVWIENMNGKVLQTLFVTQSVATGYYRYGDAGNGKWLKVPGEASRPAALPYWVNRNELTEGKLPGKQHKVADAYTGATPESSATLKFKTLEKLPDQFRVLVEVNQPWDWNFYWNNDLYPDELDYNTSAQPSVVYVVTVNLDSAVRRYFLNPVGHGHYSGKDGLLYTDLSTLTSALRIFDKIVVDVKPIE
jgi:hypothetical protein